MYNCAVAVIQFLCVDLILHCTTMPFIMRIINLIDVTQHFKDNRIIIIIVAEIMFVHVHAKKTASCTHKN